MFPENLKRNQYLQISILWMQFIDKQIGLGKELIDPGLF